MIPATQLVGIIGSARDRSWLNSAMTCPERGRLIAIEKLPYDHTDSAAIGTACHAAIEATLREQVDTYDAALNVAQEAYWRAEREPDFTYVKHSARTAWNAVQTYFEQWWYHFEPHTRLQKGWELEQSFVFPLVDDARRLIEISGTYDAFDGFKLHDWKTSGRGEYDVNERRRWSLQPTVYTKAIHHLTGDHVPFRYVVMHAEGLQQFDVFRTEDDWDWLAEQCEAFAYMIESQLKVWPKNDQHWLCARKWCPAFDTCKGKHYM